MGHFYIITKIFIPGALSHSGWLNSVE